jgi:hypothetical protein
MKRWSRKPYTPEEIMRAVCCRCGGVYRPLCPDCDIALNAFALAYMHVPGYRRKIRRYRDFVMGGGHET